MIELNLLLLSWKAPGVPHADGLDLLNIIMGWKIKVVFKHMEFLWRIVFIVAVDVTYRLFFSAKERISKGWDGGESARLLPMWPRFLLRRRSFTVSLETRLLYQTNFFPWWHFVTIGIQHTLTKQTSLKVTTEFQSLLWNPRVKNLVLLKK